MMPCRAVSAGRLVEVGAWRLAARVRVPVHGVTTTVAVMKGWMAQK
ncbi:hypothetical protein P3T39_007233 [Kitasatospora sp. GP82]|nr:hypothetical protein [Kitasatospora sp. GP82]